jgi:triosephosphate isomerase
MRRKIFAANWKMHVGPTEAREFMQIYLQRHKRQSDREVWFFPPAVTLTTVAGLVEDRSDISVGPQNSYWEEKGAFTGEISVGMAKDAGARVGLVGHSERRHVFGESDEEAGKKVRSLLDGGVVPVFCVGEKIEEREAGQTSDVIRRQLSAGLAGLDAVAIQSVVIAYEPVWAIGTGKTATPQDAATVHADIRAWLNDQGADGNAVSILYGGSVKTGNARELMAQPDVDGVLVGGASLDPVSWSEIASVSID